jgi:hypothetical protein
MTMPTAPKRTEARKTVLEEVMAERVFFVGNLGTFYVDDRPVSGSRRRSYAEMRREGFVVGTGRPGKQLLKLTPKGEGLAKQWGLTSR